MNQPTLDSELNRLRIDPRRKGRRRRRAPWRWIVVLVLAALGWGGLRYYRDSLAPLDVRIVPVERRNPNGTPGAAAVLTAGGYVIPRNNIEISSKIVARVREVLVKRGDAVRKGDVLIRLDDEEYTTQLAAAEARLASAQARLAELEAGSRAESIEAARATMEAARAAMQGAKDDLDRLSGLDRDTIVSQQEIVRARTAHEVAVANYEAARRQFELVQAGPRREEIDAARAAVAEAEAGRDFARTQLDWTVIRSPVDGTILEKVAEVGELVTNANYGGTRGPQSSVVSMADLTDLQIEIDLNENDIAKASMGQACQIRLDSVPDAVFHGEIDEIAPQADRQKGTVQVKVRILDPAGRVRPESNARVTFLNRIEPGGQGAAGRGKAVVLVPRAAVVMAAGGAIVYVAADGVARARAVQLGAESERGVEVLSGLDGSESIIVDPPAHLADGRRIMVNM